MKKINSHFYGSCRGFLPKCRYAFHSINSIIFYPKRKANLHLGSLPRRQAGLPPHHPQKLLLARNNSSGQALVVLLVFMIVSLTIASAATVLILVNSLSSSRVEQGIETDALAESGIENALLQSLRNPLYTGETLTMGSGSVKVVVEGVGIKMATSSAVWGNFTRQVEVKFTDLNNVLNINSWTEIF